MRRTEALVIAAHGVSKKRGIENRLACGQADQVAQGLLTQRIGLLASQVQINKWHQVALLCFFIYYYKRVTFCVATKKSHTYF
ncbi:hypothetical protein B9Z38_03940 [Limnohabitans sp. MMS-10A-160]|nr:hypothetical protein B9Z38_03940 [Limnohabitans sp. MMS-10A-160]